jgi:hypothetical protein
MGKVRFGCRQCGADADQLERPLEPVSKCELAPRGEFDESEMR